LLGARPESAKAGGAEVITSESFDRLRTIGHGYR